jgi:exodeoxyribonuclease X
MLSAVIVDTEVSGLVGKEPIEVAWMVYGPGCVNGVATGSRFRPEGKLEAGSVLIHGILPSDLESSPPSKDARGFVPAAEYWIGHNIDFDWEVLGKPEVKRICTLALTKALFPGFGSYRLGALYYERYGISEKSRLAVRTSEHAAGGDVILVAHILDWIAEAHGISDPAALWKKSEESRVPVFMPFGKHKGQKIAELPDHYRKWCLGNLTDIDEYLRKALETA